MHQQRIHAGLSLYLTAFLIASFLAIPSGFSSEISPKDTLQTAEYDHQSRLELLLASENHTAILAFLDSLRQSGHYNEQLSWQYARSLFLAGRLDAARDSLLKWEDDTVYQTRAESLLVQIAIQQRNHHEAVKYLIRLRNRYPDNPVYPHRLARVFTSLNQLPEAAGQYGVAYELDSLNQLVIGEWADVLQKLEFTEAAYLLLKQGIEVSPDNQGFRRQMVAMAYRLRHHEEVIEHASFLTQQGDTTAQAVKLKAFALFQADSINQAEFWIDYLLNNDLHGEDVFFYKGWILSARGDKAGAQEYYHKASLACMSANFNNFALQAGVNLYETAQYDAAIRWLQMLRTFSQNPMITFYLASTYHHYYEDRQPALRQFRLFLDQSQRETEHEYRQYARARIREINEHLHFQGY